MHTFITLFLQQVTLWAISLSPAQIPQTQLQREGAKRRHHTPPPSPAGTPAKWCPPLSGLWRRVHAGHLLGGSLPICHLPQAWHCRLWARGPILSVLPHPGHPSQQPGARVLGHNRGQHSCKAGLRGTGALSPLPRPQPSVDPAKPPGAENRVHFSGSLKAITLVGPLPAFLPAPAQCFPLG